LFNACGVQGFQLFQASRFSIVSSCFRSLREGTSKQQGFNACDVWASPSEVQMATSAHRYICKSAHFQIRPSAHFQIRSFSNFQITTLSHLILLFGKLFYYMITSFLVGIEVGFKIIGKKEEF
jgi:hypothetical protein